MACVLVTGGAGYIGSHTCVELLLAGHEVVVVDNLCNAKPEALSRIEELGGRRLAGFYREDVRDRSVITGILGRHDFESVLHFAALKAVGESVQHPLRYYDNNVAGTVALAQAMASCGLKRLVFSSSATVYGDPAAVPVREDFATGASNPYGRSKWMMEQVLKDLAEADPDWRIALLRYFNPVGAHCSGRMGEDPCGVPNNLMPLVSQVAVGRRPDVQVFGDDYPTPDGTGVRDYIHVMDLAAGHVKALAYLAQEPGLLTLNLGTGRGYSVLEVIREFEAASGRSIPYRIVARRPGDVAECWADPALAERLLGWRAQRNLAVMCQDAWRWQASHPEGYPG